MTAQSDTELSERELEILELVATGASNKEIAHKLSISPNTVKVHLRNIFGKIGVVSRTEAAMYAVKVGIVPTGSELENVTEVEIAGDLPQEKSGRKWIYVVMVVAVVFGIVLVISWYVFRRSRPEPIGTAESIATVAAGMTAQRWQKLAEMPTARAGFGAVAYDGKIYAIAGETVNGPTGSVEVYDPTADTWESRTPKPITVADVQAAVIGGKIYVPGGRLETGEITSTMEIYDPVNDAWELGASVPQLLSSYAMVAYEGNLYLFGGWDGNEYLDIVWTYDPSLDHWYELTSMPVARAGAAAATSGEQIFILNGRNVSGMLDVNEAFLPVNVGREIPWKQVAPSPARCDGCGATSIADTIYKLGTDLEDSYSLFVYFPALDSWQSLQGPFTDSWSRLALTSIGGQLFALGGEIKGETVNFLYRYQAIYTIAIPVIR